MDLFYKIISCNVPSGFKKCDDGRAEFLGAMTGGVLTTLVTHPLDTGIKRLIVYPERIFRPGTRLKKSFNELKQVACSENASLEGDVKFSSLYAGLGAALLYKSIRVTYFIGGQSAINKWYENKIGPELRQKWGEDHARIALSSLSGTTIGVGELMFHPINRWMTLKQTNISALENKSFFSIVKTHKFQLLTGWQWALSRNIPWAGSFFGATEAIKMYGFKLDKDAKPTIYQNLAASGMASVFSNVITNPQNVVKMRLLNLDFDQQKTGKDIIEKTFRKQGLFGFMKGAGLNSFMAFPNIAIGYTLVNEFTKRYAKVFENT